MSRRAFECVVLEGETLSAAVDLGGRELIGIVVPAGLVVTAITFRGAYVEDGDFEVCRGSSSSGAPAALTTNVSAGAFVGFAPELVAGLLPWRFVKVELPDDEAADRTFQLIARSPA